MRKIAALSATLMIAASACFSGTSDAISIRVDYSHDEFASFIADNFPGRVTARPGTELVFKQTWTGEPHSVTGGTLVDELMKEVSPYIEMADRGEEIPDAPPPKVAKLEENVPWSVPEGDEPWFEGDEPRFNQTAAQPCYLTRGKPSKDGKPCKTREQPEFSGKHTYYNSGLIPYEGPQGNEYRVKLSEDIEPGSYWFYCNVHGEFQSTEVVVKTGTAEVDSPTDSNRRARKEIQRAAAPMARIFNDARADNRVTLRGPGHPTKRIRGNLAGLFAPESPTWHSINEFIPRRIRARPGQKITWNVLGFHTISFGVPEYFPILTFEESGTVKRNPKLDPPAGGARKFEPPEGGDEGEEIVFDGGTYDGRGFWSSGVLEGEHIVYSMRIRRPGTYRYACLVHPPMVGTIVVRQ